VGSRFGADPRATPLAQTLGRDEVFQALDRLERAIARDPGFGLAQGPPPGGSSPPADDLTPI